MKGVLREPDRYGWIGGAEVCQMCGEVGTFFGWNAAMGFHFPWQGTEFVCRPCQSELIPAGVDSISERSDAVWSVLDARESRYCQLCQAETAHRKEKRVGRHWVCTSCRQRLSEMGVEESDRSVIDQLVKRRYVSRRYRAER